MKISKTLSDLTDVSCLLYKNTMTAVLTFEDKIDSVDIVEDTIYVHLKLGLTQTLQIEYPYEVITYTHTDKELVISVDRSGYTDFIDLDIKMIRP